MGNPRADCECYCKSLVATRQQSMWRWKSSERIEELSSNYKEKFTISNEPIQRSGSEESLRSYKQTRRKVTRALQTVAHRYYHLYPIFFKEQRPSDTRIGRGSQAKYKTKKSSLHSGALFNVLLILDGKLLDM